MAKGTVTREKNGRYQSPAGWFDSFPPVDPAGWVDGAGWCRRHWAPIAQITDPARRGCAERVASLELMVAFAADLRRQVAPLPVPAHHLAALIRALSPVCCRLGDPTMQAIILAAQLTAETWPARTVVQ